MVLVTGTHSFHQWKVKSRAGKLLGVHMGELARGSGSGVAQLRVKLHASGKLP